MAEENDKSILDINPYELDKELARQPKLYYKYAKKLADAKFEMGRVKAALEFEIARVSLDIRKRPQDYELSKTTDSAVEARMRLDERVVDANNQYLEARKDVDDLDGIVEALDHKKQSLTSLVYLQGQGYLADKFPKQVQEVMEQEVRKDTRQGIKRD